MLLDSINPTTHKHSRAHACGALCIRERVCACAPRRSRAEQHRRRGDESAWDAGTNRWACSHLLGNWINANRGASCLAEIQPIRVANEHASFRVLPINTRPLSTCMCEFMINILHLLFVIISRHYVRYPYVAGQCGRMLCIISRFLPASLILPEICTSIAFPKPRESSVTNISWLESCTAHRMRRCSRRKRRRGRRRRWRTRGVKNGIQATHAEEERSPIWFAVDHS